MKRILVDVNVLLDTVLERAPHAEAAGCDLIVTRDPAGFPASPVQTVDPATALALLEREGGTDRLSEPRRATYVTGRRTGPGRARRRMQRRASVHTGRY